MVKRPKEINKIVNKIAEAGYDAYCAGHCVMAAYLGEEPLDWDIYTDCPQEKLTELFDEGEKVGKRVIRLDYTVEVKSDDVNVADSYEGVIADLITYEATIEDELKNYAFTAETIAEHSQKSPIDPYGGREDIKKLILKPAGDIVQSLEKRPIRILEAVKYASLYNLDMSKGLSEAITKNSGLLARARKADILEEMLEIVNGDYAGKALKMLAGLGLVEYIIGKKASQNNRREADEYRILCERIDQIKHVPLRRLNLFYYRFRRHYDEAVEYLPHSEHDKALLLESKTGIRSVYFINNSTELKRCIHRRGWESFNYLDRLLKAEAILFDYNTAKIEGRDAMLREIIMNKEPIFEEDLVIDVEDIIEAGITDSPQRAAFLMTLLPDVVHKKPENNTRKILLINAKRLSKSKLSRSIRGVTWLR
ncbi:MAG: hypothetical protein GX663_01650 [Clostridiales bacterium]|nr:hypothetical protein [Clostridiales bacterium]